MGLGSLINFCFFLNTNYSRGLESSYHSLQLLPLVHINRIKCVMKSPYLFILFVIIVFGSYSLRDFVASIVWVFEFSLVWNCRNESYLSFRLDALLVYRYIVLCRFHIYSYICRSLEGTMFMNKGVSISLRHCLIIGMLILYFNKYTTQFHKYIIHKIYTGVNYN